MSQGRGARILAAAVVAGAALAASRGRAEELAYVTSAARDSVAVIDASVDAMVDEIPLGVGRDGLAASPDGSRLYAVDDVTGTLAVIDVGRGAVERRFPLGGDPRGLVLSADGRFAFIAGQSLRRLDLRTGELRVILDDGSYAYGLALSGDGSRLYAAMPLFGNDAPGLIVVDAATAGVLTTGGLGVFARAVALSPDGTRVYLVGSSSGQAGTRVQILDAFSMRLLNAVHLGGDKIPTDALITADGRTLYVSLLTTRQALLVVDAGTGRLRRRIDTVASPQRLALSADGRRLFVTSAADGAVAVLDAASGDAVDVIPAGAGPLSIVAVPAEPEAAYVAGADGVRAVAAGTASAVVVPSVSAPNGIAVTRDGSLALVAGRASGNVGIVDLRERRLTAAVATGGAPFDVELDAGDRLAFAGNFAAPGAIFVIDVAAAALTDVLAAPDQVSDLALLPDGQRLLAASGSGSVATVDVAGGAPIALTSTGPANGIAASADGRTVVVAAEQPDAIRAFAADAGGLLSPGRVVEVQSSSQPCAVAMRRDGSRAYVNEYFGARVFALDVASGRLTTSPSLALPYVTFACGLALSADERRVYLVNTVNRVVSVLDAETLALRHHIPGLPGMSRIAIGCPGGCPSPPPRATATPTATAPPTATPAPCRGDCNGDGGVTVDDLVAAVGVALESQPAARCRAGDLDGDGRIVVSELVSAVTSALAGCAGGA